MKKVFNLVRIVAFILLVSVILGYWNEVFKFKDQNGMVGMDIYYRQPEDSVDLLIVGSSHAFVGINTGTLWDEYGIASYLIGANLQPMSNSYYYLKEALKTQSPEVVVLEAYMLTDSNDYLLSEFIVNNTYGMQLSEDTLEAINDSIPPSADITEYGLYYGRYHTRYDELSQVDFTYGTTEEDYYTCFKGYHNLIGSESFTKPQYNPRRDLTTPLSLRVEYYYRKICQLCQDRGIELVIVVSPYAGYCDDERMKYNEGRTIAREYGFEFIDYNEYYNQMDLDFETDFRDAGHMNVFGTRKFSEYLGQYIESTYDLPDRRLDESGIYDTWEMNAKFLEADYYSCQLITEWAAVDYYSLIRDLPEEFVVIVNVTNPRNLGQETKRFLGYYNIPCIRYNDSQIWVIQDGLARRYDLDENGMYFEDYYGSHHIAVSSEGVFLDGSVVYHMSTGLEVTVLNELYGELVEGITLDGDVVWRS